MNPPSRRPGSLLGDRDIEPLDGPDFRPFAARHPASHTAGLEPLAVVADGPAHGRTLLRALTGAV